MEAAPPAPDPAPGEPPPAPPPTLADQFVEKLAAAPAPLKFADLKKGFAKAKKQPKDVFEADLREALVSATRSGRAFAHPSGKKGEERYWSRDERHAIREEALKLAGTPDTLATLVKGGASPSDGPQADRPSGAAVAAAGEFILAAIRGKPVASLADVRREMPADYRGAAFDAAVLDLSDRKRAILYQDDHAAKYDPEQRRELVSAGASLYTAISVRE